MNLHHLGSRPNLQPATRAGQRDTGSPAGLFACVHFSLLAPVVWILLAIASSVSAGEIACPAGETPHASPGALFETVEEAAQDALAHAHHTARSRDRGRLRLGTIYRVGDGYAYSEPMRSDQTVWGGRRPVLRFALRPVDVASYVLHPPSGSVALDRVNERLNASQRRIVDELDPLGRPLYVLTPSRRVLRYADRVEAEVATRVVVADDRSEPVTVATR